MTHWRSQFKLLWWGQCALMLALGMSNPYWPLIINQFHHLSLAENQLYAGMIYCAPLLACIFSAPLWGKLGDRIGHKKMLLRASLSLTLVQLLLGLSQSLYLYISIRLLQGIFAGFIATSQAWSLNISPTHKRGKVIGSLQAATAIGTMAGPIVGGAVAEIWNYHILFYASSLICLACYLHFLINLVETRSTVKKRPTVSPDKPLSKPQLIVTLLVLIITVQLARNTITPFFALYAKQILGANEMTIGLLYGAMALTMFFCAPRWGAYFDKLNARQSIQLLCLLLLVSALIQIGFIMTTSLYFIFCLRILWGVCLAALLPLLYHFLFQQRLNAQGYFIGLGQSASKLGTLSGVIIGSLSVASFGLNNGFLINSIIYLLAAIISLSLIPLQQNKSILRDQYEA